MRERHNEDLQGWAAHGSGAGAGGATPRPEAKHWVDDIFGAEWSRIKARAAPPIEMHCRRPARKHRY